MGKRSSLVRIDPSLKDLFKEMKKQGEVQTFPEFSRLIAGQLKSKKKDLRFFK